jgi:hypothetical protein
MDERKNDQRRTDPRPKHDSEEIEREARKNRELIAEVPEPGTDPLHEGP